MHALVCMFAWIARDAMERRSDSCKAKASNVMTTMSVQWPRADEHVRTAELYYDRVRR
jgi:hypothetical protein